MYVHIVFQIISRNHFENLSTCQFNDVVELNLIYTIKSNIILHALHKVGIIKVLNCVSQENPNS
jgi:hypothetical protein